MQVAYHATDPFIHHQPLAGSGALALHDVSGVSRTKIDEVTLDALRTRQSLVKGERLVRHEMRAVLSDLKPGIRLEHHSVQRSGKQT